MGARWNWEAICEKGHIYGNFSGGADECYECGAACLVEFSGDDAMADLRAFLGVADVGVLAPEEVLGQLRHVQGVAASNAERNARAIREYDHLRTFHKCEAHPTDGICKSLMQSSSARSETNGGKR